MNNNLIIYKFLIIIFYLLLNKINYVQNFNVDLHSYVRHTYHSGSMYGFSIAMHKATENGILKNWLIVGAPKANVTEFQTKYGIKQTGAVFRCQLDDDNRCQLIPFDQHGNKLNTNNEQIDTKSNQWFGATVASGGVDKPIVACAPRYVFHGMQPSKVERIEPVGTCFTAEDFKVYREYSPCRTNFWGYHRQGYCQAGFSAAISQTGDRLFIGAPGSWYWQGQVYSINTKSEFPYKPGYYQPFGDAGQIYSLDPTANTSQVYSTRESSSNDDDSYLGYSMAVGKLGGSEINDIAVGMPRGDNLKGKVAIFSWTMQNLHNITGKQIGGYFGYSLCIVDINGDNLDDLIIGAPMYTEPNNDGKYDIGRVYVIRQSRYREKKFEDAITIDGFRSRGRFGTALTSLNDINNDGYKDFAVGAPYDGRYGEGGAVYIYHGSRDVKTFKPVQVIYAEDLAIPYPRTFGFSLSGGMDLDGNSYPDLAVGAYESDSVFFFKSRPVVLVNSDVKFLTRTKRSEIGAIDIENNKECQIGGHYYACVTLHLCINYNESNIPNNPNLNFNITIKLDAKAKIPRMYSIQSGLDVIRRRIPLHRPCTEEEVYITNNIQDKLTPMEVEVEYDIVDVSRPTQYLRRDPLGIPPPIVDQRSDPGRKAAIHIQKNCGYDNVCIPDLTLAISSVNEYVLDDRKRLDINVTIQNVKEDAFETRFYMTIPKGLQYASAQTLQGSSVSAACTVKDSDNLVCDIGNPFISRSVAKFKIGFDVIGKEGYPPNYNFQMEVNSTNEEEPYTRINNKLEKRIKLVIKTDFNIHGNTPYSFGYYKAENYKKYDEAKHENDLGPEVIHAYNFRNNGSATIGKIIIAIAIPVSTIKGKPLMYVLNTPEYYGNIRCNQIPPLNSRNLQYDYELSIKSYLSQIGATASSMDRKKTENAVDIQSSTSSRGNTIITYRNYTEEQKRQDDTKDSPGDASETHSQRANQASSIRGGGGGYTQSHWSTQGPAFIESGITAETANSMSGPDQGINHFRTGTIDLGIGTPQGGYQGGQQGTHQGGQQGNYYGGQQGGYQTGQQGGYQGSYQGGQQGGYQGSYQGGQQGGYQGGYQGSNQGGQQGGQQGVYQTGGGGGGGSYYSSSGFRNSGTPTQSNYSYSTSWHSGGGGSGGAGSGIHNDNYLRQKRQIYSKTFEEEKIYTGLKSAVNCSVTNCFLMECEISRLESEEDAWVSLRTRLVAETLAESGKDWPVNVSTMAAAAIVNSPYLTNEPYETVIKTHEIVYTAYPEPEAKDDVIPLWVVVLSACAGTLILLLLAFLLYKCGFFKRSRPSDSSERQPLNRNGNYHGDEHL